MSHKEFQKRRGRPRGKKKSNRRFSRDKPSVTKRQRVDSSLKRLINQRMNHSVPDGVW